MDIIINVPNLELIKLYGIYMITNNINGKVYIGQTIRPFIIRWKEHQGNLIKGIHHNKHLQNAYNKYGAKSFSFSIIELLPDEFIDEIYSNDITIKKYNEILEWLNNKEIFYIKEFRNKLGEINVYNNTTGGKNCLYTEEYKKHLSKIQKERCNTDEHKKLQSDIATNLWKDDKYRNKVLESRKETYNKPEYKIKRSELSKEINNRPNVKKQRSEIMIKIWNDIKYANSVSKGVKRAWKQDKYRNNLLKKMNIRWNNPEEHIKHSITMKNVMHSKTILNKISTAAIHNWKNIEYANKVSNSISKKCKENNKKYDLILHNFIKYIPNYEHFGYRKKKWLINQIAEKLKELYNK